MTRQLRQAALLLLLTAGACAPASPPFATVAAGLPPVPAGEARVFFYRWLEPYDTVAPTTAYLNLQPMGISSLGSVFYRDVDPGQYLVSVSSPGRYPDQFKTVALAAGETVYVRIESARSWACSTGGGDRGSGGSACLDTFVVRVMDPASARAEMQGLSFTSG